MDWWDLYNNLFKKKKSLTNLNKISSIEVGERIGWRCWEIQKEGLLVSVVYTSFIWDPKKIVKATNINTDPNLMIDPDWCWPHVGGIHCYKERSGCTEWTSCLSQLCPLVVGTIEIWGDMVEHEKGYRGEYAWINSIDEVLIDFEPNENLLKKMQELYNVGFYDGTGTGRIPSSS